ncbi:MAG: hypothetical protein H0T79_07855 [Deltaproteobacteria bacterium]|nr:hypothetical protein [Deltaproteobacteria bacterium]
MLVEVVGGVFVGVGHVRVGGELDARARLDEVADRADEDVVADLEQIEVGERLELVGRVELDHRVVGEIGERATARGDHEQAVELAGLDREAAVRVSRRVRDVRADVAVGILEIDLVDRDRRAAQRTRDHDLTGHGAAARRAAGSTAVIAAGTERQHRNDHPRAPRRTPPLHHTPTTIVLHIGRSLRRFHSTRQEQAGHGVRVGTLVSAVA